MSITHQHNNPSLASDTWQPSLPIDGWYFLVNILAANPLIFPGDYTCSKSLDISRWLYLQQVPQPTKPRQLFTCMYTTVHVCTVCVHVYATASSPPPRLVVTLHNKSCFRLWSNPCVAVITKCPIKWCRYPSYSRFQPRVVDQLTRWYSSIPSSQTSYHFSVYLFCRWSSQSSQCSPCHSPH